MNKRIRVTAGLLFCISLVQAQISNQLSNLKAYIPEETPAMADTTLKQVQLLPGDNIHYLYPFYQLFGQEDKFRRIYPGPAYTEMLSRAAAMAGDYSSALEYEQESDSTPVTETESRQIYKNISLLKNIKNVDARRFIVFIAPQYRVIMLNEAYNKPLHRAFAFSLLDDLFKRGFRYLAMEMLNPRPDQDLSQLTQHTGLETAEPVAGEMIRYAIDRGFHLVAYEDPEASKHSPREIDSIRAANIYAVIQRDTSARIFVFAGYAHIAETSTSPDFIPMGMAFKKISGIDPLTIDQTDMTEASNFAYGRAFYNAYLEKFPISGPSIALDNDEPVNYTGTRLFDLTVVHPRTSYMDSRPTWLSLDGRRQPVYVKSSSTGKDVFLVQAYYTFESLKSVPGHVVPADQTWLVSPKGNYLLYLRRGKYIVIFRDMHYRTLFTRHIEVN